VVAIAENNVQLWSSRETLNASIGIAAAAFADERYILVLARPVLPRKCLVELLFHSDV
jgi:hypothetical protein